MLYIYGLDDPRIKQIQKERNEITDEINRLSKQIK